MLFLLAIVKNVLFTLKSKSTLSHSLTIKYYTLIPRRRFSLTPEIIPFYFHCTFFVPELFNKSFTQKQQQQQICYNAFALKGNFKCLANCNTRKTKKKYYNIFKVNANKKKCENIVIKLIRNKCKVHGGTGWKVWNVIFLFFFGYKITISCDMMLIIMNKI